jgi:nucleotide-binding universal stress UspA family protein
MFRKILVPTDGTPLSEKAAQGAIDLAQQFGGAPVAVTVVPPYQAAPAADSMHIGGADAYRERQRETAQFRLSRIAALAARAGIDCETVFAESASTHREIVDTARRRNCELIVMGSHGHHGLAAMIVGTQTQKVLAESDIPVLICH